MNFFGLGKKKSPSPQELWRLIRSDLEKLEKLDPTAADSKHQIDKLNKDAAERLTQVLSHLPLATDYEDKQLPSDEARDAIVSSMLSDDTLVMIARDLGKYEFEVKRLVSQIFSNLMTAKEEESGKRPALEYVLNHKTLIDHLVAGYEASASGKQPTTVPHVGEMLRACAGYDELVRYVLETGHVYRLIDAVKLQNFDVASDAFVSLREFLVKKKNASAEFIQDHFDEFFDKYWEILNTSNYVTVRQSLKVLSELLLDRTFLRPMLKYVKNEKFLMLHMDQLRNESKAIAFEAFHLFKIFVANPQKPPRVHKILYANRDRIIRFLNQFLVDREEEQFVADKQTILQKLEQLPPPPDSPTQTQAAPATQQPQPQAEAEGASGEPTAPQQQQQQPEGHERPEEQPPAAAAASASSDAPQEAPAAAAEAAVAGSGEAAPETETGGGS
ncbi:unnamed protein product [Vitrella brassicaformis CCMP3155]|uniref:Mo25-like protein n=1 Tax=Vitrella brassicaformis (strain CCMP3155) TaxID=1169540 RepID=A0A0G4F345_VITBC|nr:unnamed protein product [Vitrella brassicaformis CCMP3155]|mmetsp:Transcript_21313/g.52106  ORF Transcript_21313/g.52106 Transcript_21313/m.52106 type:complete len:444 (-) Transcript_21313:120-1451(-)|eukprot:CEM06464.1 unnamed protein product [Vitrella brassicaformis CCMP3155]